MSMKWIQAYILSYASVGDNCKHDWLSAQTSFFSFPSVGTNRQWKKKLKVGRSSFSRSPRRRCIIKVAAASLSHSTPSPCVWTFFKARSMYTIYDTCSEWAWFWQANRSAKDERRRKKAPFFRPAFLVDDALKEDLWPKAVYWLIQPLAIERGGLAFYGRTLQQLTLRRFW